MFFNKNGGRIFGVQFTKKEQEAIDREIRVQCAAFEDGHDREFDAIVLWLLHEKFGFGEMRLRRFYDLYSSEVSALLDRYKMEKSDAVWLCTQKLKEYGIDIEAWEKESGP